MDKNRMDRNESRRDFMGMAAIAAGSIAAGGLFACGASGYGPRIVCNMYYWNQLFSTPYRYISRRPDPLAPQAGEADPLPPSTGGIIWSGEEWNTAFSDVRYAGYRRIEMVSATMRGTPAESIESLLGEYGLALNHIWHSGRLYPDEAAEKTIADTIEVLELARRFNPPDFFFDPFGDKGPLTDEEAECQNRGLDRIGRESADRGMKLCVHNHEGPMRYGAKEWLGVLRGTDPATVFMCLDMDWTWQAGTDPFPLLHEAGDAGRLGALHMRTQHDRITDQTMEDGGDIDFHRAAAYLKEIEFTGALVEETEWMRETRVTRTPRENKKIAREWCERVFGVSAQM